MMFPAVVETKARSDDMKQVLANSYNTIDSDVRDIHSIKTDFSGTSLCTVLIKGKNICAANVGDSRAFLISSTEILPLTKQQRPDDPIEHARITQTGARVLPLKDLDGRVNGPHRVWLPEIDFPGLATSRSIGDYKLHQFGVNHEP
jgi:serine/threonine protein phosphatase PrpC